MKGTMILLGSIYLLAVSTIVSSTECPAFCTCSEIIKNHQTFHTARCEKLDGLRQLGTTSHIQILDLSNIEVARITNQLEKLKNLTELNLSNNKLAEIGKLSKRIKVLDLSHNRITSGKLSKLPQYVQHLNLSDNDITNLPLEFKKLHNIKSLDLSDNPINCTCETLEIRNWLKDKNVWFDSLVKCMAPIRYKGKPWLQVRQGDVCTQRHESPRMMASKWNLDDDNDIMMGDAPIFDDAGSGEDKDDELGSDFMVVGNDEEKKKARSSDNTPAVESKTDAVENYEDDEDDYYGSGDHMTNVPDITISPISSDRKDTLEETTDIIDEGSGDDGSGAGIIIPILHEVNKLLDNSPNNRNSDNLKPDQPDDLTFPPTDIETTTFKLGIFGVNLTPDKLPDSSATPEDVKKTDSMVPDPIVPEPIVPAVVAPSNAAPVRTDKADIKVEPAPNAANAEPSKAEGKGIYIILAIFAIVVVGLIIVVIIKRSKTNRNRRRQPDAENPKSTEMIDMNKKLLGKPVERNGNSENSPLMSKDRADDAVPFRTNGERKPLDLHIPDTDIVGERPRHVEQSKPLQTFQPEAHPEKPASDRRNSSYENLADDGNNNNNGPVDSNDEPMVNGDTGDDQTPKTNPDNEYWPSSPKLSRYSPVYSPETGRVKIKLAETPKPKTPILVSRTRSNAGDIITTPVSKTRNTNNSTVQS